MTEHFFDWTTLPFAPEEYRQRRAKMVAQLRRSGGGVYLTPSRHGRSGGETFRQLNDFIYFTGLELPDSVLAIDSNSAEVTVFAPEEDDRFANPSRPNDFPGRPLAADGALAEQSGISDIRPLSEFTVYLNSLRDRKRMVRVNPKRTGGIQPIEPTLHLHLSGLEGFIYYLQQLYPTLRLKTVYPELARLRMVKSAAEIACMRQACELGMQGIRHAVKFIRPGVTERTLEAELEAEFKRGGAQRLPFDSIIKSGPNALYPWRILAAHYDRRNRAMQAGEVVIFDVGCELNYYGSDMGRTFPVSGKFTAAQIDILQMQKAVTDAIIGTIRPGVTLLECHEAGLAVMPKSARPFMQVGLFFGHHIGLSMSDPNLPHEPLEAGMVITVEPWYYNHEQQLATFLEDVILITAEGHENLTAALPRTPEGLEQLITTP